MNFFIKIALLFSLVTFSNYGFSGTDLVGKVERIQINSDGMLWIKLSEPRFDEFCKVGWYGFNAYIPQSDKNYPYYYGLITTALTNDHYVRISNISHFDGTKACDITQTGYGLVLLKH
jgi:hypothetical protein